MKETLLAAFYRGKCGYHIPREEPSPVIWSYYAGGEDGIAEIEEELSADYEVVRVTMEELRQLIPANVIQ